MDFTEDTLADGRAFRTLNIVDDFTRECLASKPTDRCPGLRVARVLDRLAAERRLPRQSCSTTGLDSSAGPSMPGRTHMVSRWASSGRASRRRTPT